MKERKGMELIIFRLKINLKNTDKIKSNGKPKESGQIEKVHENVRIK